MFLFVRIYKEKKEEDYRIIILPSGRSKIGLVQTKDYGIVSYLGKGEEEKIGELVLWALEQSDEKKIENSSDIKIEKMYSNASSYLKFTKMYNTGIHV